VERGSIRSVARRITALVIEKIPLLAISAIGGYIAFISQRNSMSRARVTLIESPLEGILIVAHNVKFYLQLVFLPGLLAPQYPLPPVKDINFGNPAFMSGVVVAAAVAVLGVTAFWRGWRGVFITLVGYFLLMAPALGGVDFMGAIAADRFVYLPMLML